MQRVARRFPSGSSRCPHFLVPTGIPHRPLAFPRSSVSALSLRNAPGAGSMPYSGVQGANKDKDRRWFEWHKFRTTSSKYDPYIDFVTTEPRYGMSDVWTQGMDPPQPVFPIDVKGRSKAYLPEVLSRRHYYMKYAMLNRPMQLNALNIPLIRHLTPVLKKWQAHKETTNAIVLTSSTPDNFSSGTDFVELLQAVRAANTEFPKIYFKELYQLVSYCSSLDKPFFPIMNVGSGGALAYNSSSFKVTTEDTIFALPEVSMGFFPDAGATHMLSRLPDHVGTFLALTGKRIRGWDVLWSGIANILVPADRIPAFYEQMDELRYKFRTWEQIIQCVHAHEATKAEHPYMLKEKGYLDIIRRCFSQPTVPEIMKALSLERNPWAHQVLARLKEQCPLSLVITLRALQESSTKSLGATLRRDYRIALRFMLSRDFSEGVTARIVEKRPPVWSHKSVEDVSPEEVQFFFNSLHGNELFIKSLDEEREQEHSMKQLLEAQRSIKKKLRRPWVQEEYKKYLHKELEKVREQLRINQEKTEEDTNMMEAYKKKFEEELSRKHETIKFLQRVEAEIDERRAKEKRAAAKMHPSVHRWEWSRWEDITRTLRNVRSQLEQNVNLDVEEQLPMAAVQCKIIETLNQDVSAFDLPLDEKVEFLASAMDTAGKGAQEVQAYMDKMLKERWTSDDAQYAEEEKSLQNEAELWELWEESMATVDADDVKQSLATELNIPPEEEAWFLPFLPRAKLAVKQHRKKERKEKEVQLGSLLTLDDIAKLVLGGEPDSSLVADTRAQLEKGEVAVSEEICKSAADLMKQRAIDTSAPDDRPTVEAMFETLKDEIFSVVKAKAAGKSPEQIAQGFFTEQSKQKLAELYQRAGQSAQQNQDPTNQKFFLEQLEELSKNISSYTVDGKVQMWKLEDKIAGFIAERELLQVWPRQREEKLQQQLESNQEIQDLITQGLLDSEPSINPKSVLDEQEREEEASESNWIPTMDEGTDIAGSYQLSDHRISDRAKGKFEQSQPDLGLSYPPPFEYDKYSDRIAHFKRILQRQNDYLEPIPDIAKEPVKYRRYLFSRMLAEELAPEVNNALEEWFKKKAAEGYTIGPLVKEFLEKGADKKEEEEEETDEEDDSGHLELKPGSVQMWETALRTTMEVKTTAPGAVPPYRQHPPYSVTYKGMNVPTSSRYSFDEYSFEEIDGAKIVDKVIGKASAKSDHAAHHNKENQLASNELLRAIKSTVTEPDNGKDGGSQAGSA